jgi:hypothetical protein
MLTLLSSARWLKTSQVHRRYFAGASLSAARRRLRLLEEKKYLVRYRENRMAESLWTVGREGRRVLEKQGLDISLERRPPKQIEHYLGINDVRVAAELFPDLLYFFSCWELPTINWRHRLLPDGLIGLPGKTFAMEFDRGQESLAYFVRTKVEVYRRGLPGLPLWAVLIVADSDARMKSLIRAAGAGATPAMLFSTLDRVRERGLSAPIFSGAGGDGIHLRQPVSSKCSVDETGFDS